jgi:hypothetical protein
MTAQRLLVPKAALLVAGLFALFAWRELAATRADGRTLDELRHLAYGLRGLTAGTFERWTPALNSKMPVSVLNAVPVAVAERLAGPPDNDRRLWLGRLPTVLLGAALGWLIFHWARALFGFGGGALALFLYTFCPNVLAHSHLITTDVATALGIFAATYAFWRYRRLPGPGRLAVAAAAFGAAQLTKVTAIFLVPIFLLIVLVEAVRGRLAAGARPAPAAVPGRGAVPTPGAVAERGADSAAGAAFRPATGFKWAAFFVPALALAAGALVVLNLGFAGEKTFRPLSHYSPVSRQLQALAALPVVRDLPVPLPLPYLQGLDQVARDASSGCGCYLHGRFGDHGFWNYYLVASLIKVPLGTLALLALAVWLCAAGRVRVPGAEAFLLVPPLFLLAYLSLAFDTQIGLRYLLPAFPFAFVFAGRAAAWRPGGSPPARRAAALLVGLFAAWTAAASFSVHPRYLPYFNELVGGPRNGYRWLIDSNLDWGQDAEYMRRVYARTSPATPATPVTPIPVWIEPTGPIAGRVAVGLTDLVANPAHAWLREHFRPAEIVHNSWAVYEVGADEIERCCSGLEQAWSLPDPEGDLAPAGEAIGGAEGAGVLHLDRLNDGMLGANSEADAAQTPLSLSPVRAWFGIAWKRPQRIGRATIYPGLFSRGPRSSSFLALDYRLQWWDGRSWLDLPGTRVTANTHAHVEHRFPPVLTTRLRLLVERERNQQGGQQGARTGPGLFRAACLEIAAYPP